jgi:hypothetical protein
LETLVAEDQNGPFLKFYDARVNGGFPRSASPAPCAAADECRDVGSLLPVPARVTSSAQLGSSGNVKPARKKKARKRCGGRANTGKKAKPKRCRDKRRGHSRRRVGR